MVGIEYRIIFDATYDGVTKPCEFPKKITATMANNNPRGYVFENEEGMYIIPYNAIHMMQPVSKNSK